MTATLGGAVERRGGLVVATAGHVDHGKSTLVHRLTGTHPDRLPRERALGRTIDLGFARLPGDGRAVDLVDVPGHRDHVANALAGLGAASAVLLVVAADDGWMPQTQDHLVAARAFGVPLAAVVVTRGDLAAPATVDAVVADLGARFGREVVHVVGDRDRVREGSPSRPGGDAASAAGGAPRSADGCAGLVRALRGTAGADADRPPSLWVDRCFTVVGRGPVVTGTLTGGRVAVGQTMTNLGTGRRVVVRGLQRHGEDLDAVAGPARVAVLIRPDGTPPARGTRLLTAAVGPLPLPRGIGSPGQGDGSWDAMLLDDDAPLHACLRRRPDGRGAWAIHVGTAWSAARLAPVRGTAFVGVQPARGLSVVAGDRVVVRDLTSGRVVGGLQVLDPLPPAHRRGRAARLRRVDDLTALAAAPVTGRDAVLAARRGGLLTIGDLTRLTGRPPSAELRAIGDHLVTDDLHAQLTTTAHELVAAAGAEGIAHRDVVAALVSGAWSASAGAGQPASSASPRRSASSAGGGTAGSRAGGAGSPSSAAPEWFASLARAVIDELPTDAVLRQVDRLVATVHARPDEVRLASARAALAARLTAAGWQAPTVADVLDNAELPARLRGRLLEHGPWVVAEGRVLHRAVLRPAAVRLAALEAHDGPFTVARARDALALTRRDTVPLLVALDACGVTVRDGDLRRVVPPPARRAAGPDGPGQTVPDEPPEDV